MKALDILIYILECGGMIHVDREFMSNVSKAVEELEEHLSDKDDQIKWLREELKYHEAELEALQQVKSCDGCKYYKKDNTTDCNGFTQDEECLRFIDEIHRIPCNDFCCNRYEPKEQRDDNNI